jgi:hypothetical protein
MGNVAAIGTVSLPARIASVIRFISSAMATPAAGKRYLLLADGPTITWLDLAEILRHHPWARRRARHSCGAPGEDPSPLTIHNDGPSRSSGGAPAQPRPRSATTADSMRGHGLHAEG